ncbi:uncharacterized protein LOC115744364 [Rhodamnia argentea]|uniref:Uncharacterized protein LOC115744364 n=1 Tax=Rhodamnia argentea TaxID=178133 RepID=A0A8B8PMB6_9MYRT|nr:uncharacterized protein LOC115744364 [Rhodamnia argentea]
MVDHPAVCCMCGDIGFPEKIFCCNRCRNRYQHSYCSNFYSESLEPIEQCDWCQSELRSSSRHRGSSSLKSAAGNDGGIMKSEYSGSEKIKQQHRDDAPAPHREGTCKEPRQRAVASHGDAQVQAPQGCHVLARDGATLVRASYAMFIITLLCLSRSFIFS